MCKPGLAALGTIQSAMQYKGQSVRKINCMMGKHFVTYTLLHSFYGFPGTCYKVTILICHMEGWTFVGLKHCISSNFETK